MMVFNFTKSPCNPARLKLEIEASSITVALASVSLLGADALTVSFKADLSAGEETTLNGLVTAHTGEDLPDDYVATVQLEALPEPEPFAKPSFRTKRNKTAAWQTITEGQTVDLDFLLTEERYVSGGEIIYKGAKEGDYVKASVMDVFNGGVIPAPYRPANVGICENWPLVNEYINGEWIVPNNTNEEYKSKIINTYPLNAKITPYLVLRVTYTASAEAGERHVAVNYHLTKKLL
jgi:hypothetical protein